jgi:hypothetical protein
MSRQNYSPSGDDFFEDEDEDYGEPIAQNIGRQPKMTRQASRAQPQPQSYQYQAQSMYQIPLEQEPVPRARKGPHRGSRPPQSFYVDPGMPLQPQYVMPPQPQPYPYMMPQQVPQVIYQTAPAVDNRSLLMSQIEEMERFEGNRTRRSGNRYNENEIALQIATMVSEQDAMYGTNMLENITPADRVYIQSLMAGGMPEHEAMRQSFNRKPRPVVPPKPVGAGWLSVCFCFCFSLLCFCFVSI